MEKACRVRSGVRNIALRRGTLVLALTPLLMTCGSEPQPTTTTTPAVAWTKPVPKATCGSTDRVEPGLQGQTSLADRTSGASEKAYNCNLELVGQYHYLRLVSDSSVTKYGFDVTAQFSN